VIHHNARVPETRASRRASAEEVATWQEHGWVMLDGLIGATEIDAAAKDLPAMFPAPADYHADPAGTIKRWKGTPGESHEAYVWPAEGPGFRPEQHRWNQPFPFAADLLNRLCVHPSIVDFAERALGSGDLRLYQAGLSAKYAGETNYEQPMHTDRNHSWLPPVARAPWWHLETFLYLSDVDEGNAPTHLVSVRDSVGRKPTMPLYLPDWDRELYAAERPAVGVRGSLLAYRPDVFHRAVDLTAGGASRFLLNVSYKVAGQDWVGYDGFQARAVDPKWDTFVASCTPRELELFGFPPPGHPIWDADLVAATAERYPGLDVSPWREALLE
jgi:hypothetical protein